MTFIAHMEDRRQAFTTDMSTLPGYTGPEYQAAGLSVLMEGKLLKALFSIQMLIIKCCFESNLKRVTHAIIDYLI